MNKTILLALTISIGLLGCDAEKARKNTIEKKVREDVENSAFKNNAEVDIIALEVIGTYPTNELFLDTLKHRNVLLSISRLNKMLDNQEVEINKVGKKMVSAAAFGLDNPLYKMHEAKVLNAQEEINVLLDSLRYYYAQDSVIATALKREPSSQYYKSDVYLKIQFRKGAETHNVLDTLTYVFDSDMNMIPVK